MNHVTVIGRLSTDPTRRTVTTTNGQRSVTTVPIAIAPSRGRDGEPCWIDVICWDSLADACADHLHKGRQIAVHGRLELSRWTGDDGTRRQAHRIIANEIEFLAIPDRHNLTANDGPVAETPAAEAAAERPEPAGNIEQIDDQHDVELGDRHGREHDDATTPGPAEGRRRIGTRSTRRAN